MNDVKVNLSIKLKGSVLLSDQEAKESLDFDVVRMGLFNPSSKKVEYISALTKKSRPAEQVLHINTESYKYMISDEVPSFSSKKEWKKISKKARLEAHLKDLVAHVGGIDFHYEII